MNKDQAAARAEIAERVEEAYDTLKRLPDRDRKTLSMQMGEWPMMVRRMWEDAPAESTKVRRPPPSARQIDRMYEVMDWMLKLAKQERQFAHAVYLCCARRRKPGAAAKILGCHRETAGVWRDNGLDRMAAMARR